MDGKPGMNLAMREFDVVILGVGHDILTGIHHLDAIATAMAV